ncbi:MULTISPECIES: DUF4245 domain-containing protein [Streptomyces]|uniref:DUF4245 domain-containing protein n=1 Tax=Streptomyces TaxID=1883 RepID=UPI001671317E|nr:MULTISPECIES: DUF4245 domain-containing protein [Streptomyces]UFR02573.1 DUF4245 domain-containing protein [Streptomyces sp. Go40/10]GGS79099.1 hypothetical protein GCM10010206_46990 [Streptomyces cinerochromogenes]
MAGSNGKQKTARDMVISLVLIGIAALVVYFLAIPHDDHSPDLKRVDYRVELLTARRAASYPVAAPEGLPSTWKATSVRFQGENSDRWHLGFQTPGGQYVQVEQSTQKPSDFIDQASQGGSATKRTETIDGRTWTRYTGGRYDALVLDGTPGSTTVVAGTGSFEELRTMAAALRMK